MSRDVCIAVDLGTGGPKVGLVDSDGTIIAQALEAVATTFGPDGGAVQDAREWWTLIQASIRRLLNERPGVAQRVGAVAVTGQWASMVPVDANGEPTGPCILWMDTRGGPQVRERIGGRVAGYGASAIWRWVRTTGGAPSLSGADSAGHILSFAHEYPDIASSTRWLLEPVDYLTMRFCGVASATHASMQAAWLTDNRRLERMAYDEGLLHALGITSEKLAPLRPIGSIVTNVTNEVARDLGITPDAVVITGLPDLHAAALGAGATSLFSTHLALSTTSWISCPVAKKKTDIAHSIATVPGLTNDSYLIANNQETGAKSLDWFRSLLAGAGSAPSYDDLTRFAARSTSGAHGVRFAPWLAGERSPVQNHELRGGFTNLSVTTTTADMTRAVLEGVAANSRWLFGYIEKFCGRELSPVRLVGGGARSSLWCQIVADALDRPVEQIPDPMFAQLRGMAAMASVALGTKTLDDIESNRIPGVIFEPSPQGVAAMAEVNEDLSALFRTSKTWSRRHQSRA
ncbi:MAG: carbohydrate kinase [Acidimicrobiaceae bacterium]|nr:carbohydrate kinase [Acidimicrobiaceae bacterium]